MTNTSSELHFFNALTHTMQVSIFIDLLNQKKYDLALQIYEKLDLTQENVVGDLVREAQMGIFQPECDVFLRQQINQLTVDFVKHTLLDKFKAGKHITYDFYVNSDNILPLFSLTEEVGELHKASWINLLITKTHCHQYISFTKEHIDIFDEFTHFDEETQLRLLSQSNILEYIKLPNTYFKALDDNLNRGSYDMPRQEHSHDIDCHYAKLAVILHALFEIERPDFKAFLSQFKLTKKEKESMLSHAIADQCLFDIPPHRLSIFLEHFDLNLPLVLNKQFMFFEDERESHQLNNFLKNTDTITQYASFFEGHKEDFSFFSKPEYLISSFDDFYEFFELDKGQEKLLKFLKFTSYATKGEDKKTLLTEFHKTLTQPTQLSDYYFDENDFNSYLARLEKDILLCDMSEKEEKASKKIKI